MENKLNIDIALDKEVEFYEVKEENGKKIISIDGYFYENVDEGPHIVKCSNAEEALDNIDFESKDAINKILWSCKQYEDVTSPDEISSVINQYTGRLRFENVTNDTPNGLYINYEE